MREPSSGEVWSVVFFHSFVLTKCKRTGILTFLLFPSLDPDVPKAQDIFMWLGAVSLSCQNCSTSCSTIPSLGWAVLHPPLWSGCFSGFCSSVRSGRCGGRWADLSGLGVGDFWVVCVVLACVSVVVYGGLAFATSQCSLPWTPRRGRERWEGWLETWRTWGAGGESEEDRREGTIGL